MDTMTDVWKEVLAVCKTKVTDVMFNLWIKPLELVKFEDDTFVFTVNTEFKKSIITDKFSSMLKDSFEEVMGFPVDIAILVRHTPVIVNDGNRKKPPQSPALEFTFENFIVGSSNSFAYSGALGVAENPAVLHNPLVIYGRSGLGKTHLLLAIEHDMRLNFPDMNILYTTGEEMINELLWGVKNKNTVPFRDKYRNCDALLVDDIQFIQKSDAFQEEFFHTFDTLYRAGKQIVLTSDMPPRDMQILDERLRSRFEQGLLADVKAPDYDTRRAIIMKKCERMEISLSPEVVEYIAQNIKNNIRQLEGSVNKIQAMMKNSKAPFTLEDAREVVKDVTNESEPVSVTVDKIIDFIANIYGVTAADIKSDKRNGDIKMARQVAMYVIKEVTTLTLADIGAVFGKNHTTVLYSAKQISEKMENSQQLKTVVVGAVNEFMKD